MPARWIHILIGVVGGVVAGVVVLLFVFMGMAAFLTSVVVVLTVAVLGLAGYNLRESWRDAVLGITVRIVAFAAFAYFLHEALRYEPNDAAYSVSNAPGP